MGSVLLALKEEWGIGSLQHFLYDALEYSLAPLPPLRTSKVFMVYFLLVLNLLSLLLALVRGDATPFIWLPDGVQQWSLPAVSALTTFITGLVARFRFTLRWSKAMSAAVHLQAEIWKFRMRVDDYMVVGRGVSRLLVRKQGMDNGSL